MQIFKFVENKKEREALIDFLLRRFPYHSKKDWLVRLEAGSLTVDGKNANPDLVLRTGMEVGYDRPREDEPAVDHSYKIIFEDDYLVAVEKNGNLPIAEGGRYLKNTLKYILEEQEGYKELFPVHRLDRETSGVVVIAKTKEVATLMGKKFVKGEPTKEYHAVLNGVLAEERMVEAQMGKVKVANDDKKTVRVRQVIKEGGKDSKTLFTPLRDNGQATLVKIELFTGRTHQIRLHAEYIGHPVVGDKLYGQSDERFIQIVKEIIPPTFEPFGVIPRQLLHASSLSFAHPITGEPVNLVSPFEPIFSDFIPF
ncbi:MAG: RluA family pseudouridine synthase [SAR324 cluster bacterium]|nr:RluA family pseudouridine synthase [SAR324 cluster bacterium]